MRQDRLIPDDLLSVQETELLNLWGITARGEFLPASNGNNAVYVWAGNFMCQKAVTIVASEEASRHLVYLPVFAGVVREDEHLAALERGYKSLDIFAEAATLQVAGLKLAINLLKNEMMDQ